MKVGNHICFAICGLALACGGDSSGDGDDTGTGDTTASSADDDDDDDDDDSDSDSDPSADSDGPVDTTDDPPVSECDRTVRYQMFDGQACGRVLVGHVDSDGFDDIVAFGYEAGSVGSVTNTLHTFLGGVVGLDDGEVHCCVSSPPAGAGAIFDINGDGDGDPLWASERTMLNGDVGKTQLTLEKSIRGPQGGYTGDGLLFASSDSAGPPFTVGSIMPSVTGVIVIADGALMSMVGTGAGLGLEATNTLALDPMPTIRALSTIELDGLAGVDVVGIGPDGLYLWGGSIEGEFTDAMVIELPGDYTDMESIDVDADGNRELVLFGADEPLAFVERTNMVVVTTDGMPSLPPPATVLEVNDDLFADVVTVADGSLSYYPYDLNTRVFLDPVLLAPAGTPTDLAYGDFDNNGVDDIVVCDEQGLLVVYGPDD